MFHLGEIIQITNNDCDNLLGIVLEKVRNGVVVLRADPVIYEQDSDCVLLLGDHTDIPVNITEKLYVDEKDAVRVGNVDINTFEKIKRKEILSNVNEFYHLFHWSEKPFIPEETSLSYGGRVYDEREMMNLVDSSLDFWLTSGRYSKQFEKEFAKYIGVKYALLTNSGSSANLLAFSALTSPKLGDRRIKPGDEVITVAAGFPTTVTPMVQNGAIPVFIDVDLGTYNILPDLIEGAITSKTKAIMIAHTMGNPFDLKRVMELANHYKLWVIEDNCDALGSRYDDRITGTFGHIATSSFYPPHHMTMGEGGAVYTNDPLLKMIIESFRDWGRDCWCPSGCDNTCKKRFGWELGTLPYGYDHKYTYSHIGYNLRVTDMQAAIGLEQLKKVPKFIQRRIHNFNRLFEGLRDLEQYFILPKATDHSQPSWFGFILTLKDDAGFTRKDIVDYLEARKIQTRMLFAGNLTRQPAFQGVNYRIHGDLKNTDKILKDTFLIGVYPGLTDEMIDYIVFTIREFISTI
ncbi:CDP-6-deoxy-D-xylo-4-hexulose-3-dehydrase [Paenibacillus uliginis N3/975]|uniref:CDP-6-deoxy-D-xylo-4-hexulose-3-dehydrase n=1 Tax=Paenibacillus uliginis N3/975 TaxID=1313296 RepID=A0A1X7GC35_9BACL|nr:lipopolysaccharide biosynthesis protein RfbH [Paenibacillus uliginis]SMF67549.1 CDP-6-deoxy-D-xylo-4-hexulose-3-dehydrase [Paenibacillus uliginis N3/975]